jgi:WD40 repeat protein
LRRAVEGPEERGGLHVEPALVEALVDDVAGEPGALPLLSTALLDLWHERDEDTLTAAAYARTGGVRGAVARHAEAAFEALDPAEQRVARRVLLRLVAGGDGEALTRRRVTRAELEADVDERVARVIATFVDRRLLVADDGTVELVHEALLERWPRLAEWLEADAHGRRLHRNLTTAASAWDAGGRDAGELFRGERLAATLEWADASGDDAGLNELERTFLDESRTAFARATRRPRALLALAVVLLVAAVAAGVLAFIARGSAKHEATAAIAQRLGAQALAEPRLDRALLLAREGVNLEDSTPTRSNLLAALVRSPAALAVVHGRGSLVLDDALSPNGRMLAERGDGGSVTVFQTESLRPEAAHFAGAGQITYCGAIARPVRALAFSPDGRTLAVGDSDGHHATLALLDPRTMRASRSIVSRTDMVTADLTYARDGTLVDGEVVSCASSPPAERIVLRRGRAVIALSRPIPGGRVIGLTPDGRRLVVTSGEHTTYLLDARTFARLRTFPLAGAAAVAPLGDLAAFGQDDGSVRLVDLRRGTERQMDQRAAGRVVAVAFDADAKVLATASDTGNVDLWDVPIATHRETFAGHAGEALGLWFSPDGATLYSGSSDGSVIAWDVRGGRRLGRLFRFAPAAAGGAGLHTAPDNVATAVAVNPDSSLFVTSPGPNRVTVWRARDLAPVAELDGPCGDVSSLVFSHDGRLVAAAGYGRATVIWRLSTRRIERLLRPAQNNGVNFSPDDSLVATAGADGGLRVYRLSSGRLLAREWAPAKATLQDLDFSSDGRRVAAAGLRGDILIWNIAQRRVERVVHHDTGMLAIRFSPHGREIATGDFSGNTDVWDTATGRHVATFGGQNGPTISVTYDPTGHDILTTSSDGKLRLYDLASAQLLGAPLPGSPNAGGWGTYFPDGKAVITVSGSGTGIIWDVDPNAWKRRACRIAHRNLTRAEWERFVPERAYRATCP